MAKGLDYAVVSQKDAAQILFERGVIDRPDAKIVQWIEKNAFGKIRALWPELAAEISHDGIERLGGIETIWPGG